MKMTIEESISILENKGKYSLTEKENEAKRVAIETMRKYQKIKQIAESLKTLTIDEMSNVEMQIREVLEDGNDD